MHYNEIVQLINTNEPKILCLSETRVTKDIEDFEIDIDGYQCIRGDSSSRYTGGVIMYVKKTINFEVNELWIN
jgi:exonuclease III